MGWSTVWILMADRSGLERTGSMIDTLSCLLANTHGKMWLERAAGLLERPGGFFFLFGNRSGTTSSTWAVLPCLTWSPSKLPCAAVGPEGTLHDSAKAAFVSIPDFSSSGSVFLRRSAA